MEMVGLYLALGALAGLLAGLLGVGGGIVMVPALVFALEYQGVAPGLVMHMALGTSLGIIVLTSISSVRAHHRRGGVLWKTVFGITPGILLGSFLGAAVASLLSGPLLKQAFGVFALGLAVYLGLDVTPRPGRTLPGAGGLSAVGAGVGVVSALMGIGGGSLTVPFMVWCGVAMRQAVATAAAIGLPIALAGAGGFVVNGWHQALLPPWSLGYLHGPAVLGVGLASVLAAPQGARLAHTLAPRLLRRLFALLLLVLGARMLLS
ncbi:MAG: sulfite exporter TauE/SafE family protein [Magnetococcales bacterium]|nr:sulfite exporter TauE/SafE family protein [Magnetococcales bacterium]